MPAELYDRHAKIRYDLTDTNPGFSGSETLPKVSILPRRSENGRNSIYISAPEGRLHIVVRSYLKTKNFKKFITFKNVEID